jgi:segregation and condensation protein B
MLYIYKGATMSKLITKIEGLIYIAGDEGISLEQLAEVTHVDMLDVEKEIEALNHLYQQHESALRIMQSQNIVKLVTVDDIYPTLSFYLQLKSTRQLSQSALETLAIIAYKQPVTRNQIEEIRGVNCDLMIRKLLALDLIIEAGRETTPGRPILYQVTPEFLDVFHLMSLDDLPKWESLSLSENDDLYG